MAQREAMTPLLLECLQATADDPHKVAQTDGAMLHMYAMYLLTQFRERAAYPMLVKLFSTPGEVCFDVAGDADRKGPIEDTVSEMSWWACFREDDRKAAHPAPSIRAMRVSPRRHISFAQGAGPTAPNPSWNATVPRGSVPSKDTAKKTSGGMPSRTSCGQFSNPNLR